MTEDNKEEIQNVKNERQSLVPWIATIIFSAWIIGMGILGAGWLISKELSKSNLSNNQEVEVPAVIDFETPESVEVLGNSDAKVTIVEFADYNCTYCRQFHNEVFPRLKADYIDSGKAKFVYMDFAFLGEGSVKSAEASYCAKDQGKYWEYNNALFKSQDSEEFIEFTDDWLLNLASDNGLDSNQFKSCYEARIHKPIVELHTGLGEKYYVNSTPTVFVNGIRIEGVMPYEDYQSLIEHELSK